MGEPVGAPCAPFGLSGSKQYHEISTQLGEVVRGRARGMWLEDVRYLEVRYDIITNSINGCFFCLFYSFQNKSVH